MTYNEIIKEFQTFANLQAQVQNFGNGDLWELVEHDKEEGYKYPVLWVVDSPAQMSTGIYTHAFDVYCVDLVQRDEKDENDVKSDTNMILRDLVAHFVSTVELSNNIELNRNITFTSFTEKLSDDVTGWKINVKLTEPFIYNACQIPQ